MAMNDLMPHDNKHYITLFVVCVRENDGDEPRIMEPDKCEAWEWASWEDLQKWVKQQAEAKDGETVKKNCSRLS